MGALNKIPFSVYDFFAYLSSGAVLLAAADYIWGIGLLTQREVNPLQAVVLLILAYVAGQIVAHFSSLVFEQIVVRRLLRQPTSLLLGSKPRWRLFEWIFPNYHRPLPPETQHRVRNQAQARGCPQEGEGLLLHAYSVVTSNERAQNRLDDFRNQYGFARNMSFALLASAMAILVAHWYGPQPIRVRWAILAMIAGVTMFYRYLKFFRQFSYELLLRYAELSRPVATSAGG